MATVADYPDGIGTAGPYISRLMDQPIEYNVTRYEFEDGGVDVNMQPCGVKRWVLEYEGLAAADVTTLVNHFNTAKGRVNDFEFYHRRDAQTYGSVKYVSIDLPARARSWSNNVTVILEKLA
jgi:hypothetical protein